MSEANVDVLKAYLEHLEHRVTETERKLANGILTELVKLRTQFDSHVETQKTAVAVADREKQTELNRQRLGVAIIAALISGAGVALKLFGI